MIAPYQFKALLGVAALTMSFSAVGVSSLDSASVEVGSGSKVRMVRVGLQSHWEKRWFQRNGRHIGAHWDLQLAQWRGTAYQNVIGQHQHLTDIGLTPVFRWQADDRKGWYAEGGIGVHVLSRLYDNNDDWLSTRFQFGDHLGAGVVLANGWDLGVKVQHFSNGGIKRPNSGVDFIVFKAGRAF